MEGEVSCTITTGRQSKTPSLNSSDELNSTVKRSRPNSTVSIGRFKGVVSQQNGHWGAQIYAKHQRVWLGTFKSEKEAATAYDSAAIKLRSKDAHRNFPFNNQTLHEPKFQDQYGTDEVLSMIKDGSYPLKFADFLSTQLRNEGPEAALTLPGTYGHHNGVFRRHLFQKVLTPSDVGSLNRVVIPKACALKYFPEILSRTEKDEDNNTNYFPMTLNSTEEVKDDGTPKALSLEFYDRMMKSWKFRYCYWTSSQSYVFTKGWSRFVKDRDLKAGDIVAFYACDMNEGMSTGGAFCMIDVVCSESRIGGTTMVEGLQQGGKMEAGTQLCLGQQVVNYVSNLQEVDESIVLEAVRSCKEKKHFRLFGVQIC